MDYKKLYAEKLVSAEKAASVVKSGDWVDYGWTTGTPVAVDAAIAKRLPELENVNFRGGILMWVPEIFKTPQPGAGASGKFRLAWTGFDTYYRHERRSAHHPCIRTRCRSRDAVGPHQSGGHFPHSRRSTIEMRASFEVERKRRERFKARSSEHSQAIYRHQKD